MLRSLRIKNFAIIDDVSIEFEKGFNVFTGETGAGNQLSLTHYLIYLRDVVIHLWSEMALIKLLSKVFLNLMMRILRIN